MSFKLPHDFLADAFQSKPGDLGLAIEHALVQIAGDLVVVGAQSLALKQYEGLGLCESQLVEHPRPILQRYWGGEDHDALFDEFHQSLRQVQWNGKTLYVLRASWETTCGKHYQHWTIAKSKELADEFILDVARKTNDPGEAMLVFSNGGWDRSPQLYQAVQKSGFDDLILDEGLKSAIREDFAQFLGAQQQYKDLGLAWRRGALLIGPPGNGKTHCVRALVKELAVPSLYVQSLQHQYFQSEQLLQSVFERARELRPCVLIFEDLDALVDERNQSFFLNQLDGFEKNDGLVVLATTNHPERIDSAIIDRPSRFDRKYHFDLPAVERREEFLLDWQQRLADRVTWSTESVQQLAEDTDGFSFAYLKELVVSGLLNWLAQESANDSTMSFDQRLAAQQKLLRSQMATGNAD